MTINGEHARRVVQLFAAIFIDAPQCAAAWAVSVVRFVMDQRAREFCRQCRALGLLLLLSRRRCYLQRQKLGINRRNIGIDQIIQQAGLLRIHLLAALGKLQTLELCDLVGQLLNYRLIAVDLVAHGLDLRQELRSEFTQYVGSHLIEIGRGSHGVDFTKADRLWQQTEMLITVFKAAQ